MTEPDSGLAARAAAWRDADPDPVTRAELDGLLARGDGAALAERFEGSLAFGTAGIRAETGAGPMRMNRLTAARVAAGLARHITACDPGTGDPDTGDPARATQARAPPGSSSATTPGPLRGIRHRRRQDPVPGRRPRRAAARPAADPGARLRGAP